LAVLDIEAVGAYDVITDRPDLPFSTLLYPVVFVNDARQLVLGVRPIEVPDPVNPQLGPSDLWRVDIATGETTLLLGANTDNELRVMDQSADGSRMLYRASSATTSTVWLADPNGANRTKLYKEPGVGVWDARFNANATLVALNTTDGVTESVLAKDVGTGVVTTLRSGQSVRSPRWIAPGVLCDGEVASITGTDGDDVLVGTPGDDVIVGFGGDDVIEGRGGDDVVCAGYGNDVVRGEAGDDVIFGGPGKDELRGVGGNDTVVGESGNDNLFGGEGRDVVRGGPGADVILGQGWRDRLYGNQGRDELYGGRGDDTLRGGRADDTVRGWIGDDVIFGGAGDDILDGGPGTDVVDGNAGNDTCTGETLLNC
jgi:Ca2+-binding RTX toxin-like protein